MSCPSQTELVRLVAGELTGEAQRDLQAHVAHCPSCEPYVRQLSTTWELLGRWEVDTTGHDVADRIMASARLEGEPRRTIRWTAPWRWPVPVRAAASILLAAGIGWGTARMSSADQRPGVAPRDLAEQVMPDLVAGDIKLDHLSGGAPVGLAITFLTGELVSEEETQG